MGIIILPFLLGALFLTLFAIINTYRLFRKGDIQLKDLAFGLIISGIIFGLICLSYIIAGVAWALSPPLRIPIFMFFIPFAFYFLAKLRNHKVGNYVANLFLISIAFSGIFCLIFNDYVFELLDILGVGKHY